MGLTAVAVIAFVAVSAAVLGTTVGYLTSLSGRPWRTFTTHPWRVFWRVGVPLYLLAVVVLVVALARLPSESGSRMTFRLYLSMTPLVASAVVLLLAAVQGLRTTWQRSRWKVIAVLLPWWVLNLLQVSGEFTVGHGRATLWFLIAVNAVWLIACWIAHNVSVRLAAVRELSDTPPASIVIGR